jgi:hypothetical protein
VAPSALVDVVRGERDVSHGVSAAELIHRRWRWYLSPLELHSWLLAEGLAVEDEEGLLVPTARARSIAAVLVFLG